MKNLRKLMVFVLLISCLLVLTLPATATGHVEYDGLEVSVEMDQESYEAGASMTATIKVTNTNNRSVLIVNLEQLIPEGYVLAEGSEVSKSNFEIKAGETIELKVTFVGQPTEVPEGDAESTSFIDKLLYGYTLGIPNILLAFLAVVAIIIFMILT